MIIVLKDADFSANNIGQLELPYESEIANELVANLASGVYSQERLSAFGRFVDKLNDEGILEHVIWMSVPSMANTVVDSFTNLIDGTIATDANVTGQIAKTKYGTYCNYDSLKDTSQPRITLYDTNPDFACIATGSIEKSMGVNDYILVTPNFSVGKYICTGSGTLVSQTNAELRSAGIKSIIVATSDNEIYLNKMYTKINNVASTLSLSGSTTEGSSIDLKSVRFEGDFNFASGVRCHNHGITTIVLRFDKVLSDSECTILTNALNDYQSSFYEDDIDSIISE